MGQRQSIHMRKITRTIAWSWLILPLFILLPRSHPASAEGVVLDDFEQLNGWTATASEGANVWLLPDPGHTGMGMHIGFDLDAAGGYVIIHKDFSIPLPENYAFTFYLRGEALQNNFEFKVIDPSGKDVWWRRQRDYVFPTQWQRITVRKSRLEFAWGPSARPLQRVGAIEFAIRSGSGGKGSIWIDDLRFEEREPLAPDGVTPLVTASTSLPGRQPTNVLAQKPHTSWKSEVTPDRQWLLIDLLKNREYGGLVIDWDPDDYATSYRVETSTEGEHWTTAYTSTGGNGGRDYVYMPDAESRYIRLALERSSRGQGYGITSITVKPVEFSNSPNQFFAAIAQDGPVGIYPKYLYGKQTYWTVIGVNGDEKEGLFNEEGMLEVGKGAFSIEPFLYADGNLLTWNEVQTVQELDDGYLPIPSVVWEENHLRLQTTAFAAGEPGSSTLYARYRIENHADKQEQLSLFLAIRPFQVNPPWQSLNMNGGVATIRELKLEGRTVRVNGDRTVVSLTRPDGFGAAPFEQSPITDFLRQNKLPSQSEVSDPFGFASGVFQYKVDLAPGARAEVDLAIPFYETTAAVMAGLIDPAAFVQRQLDDTRHTWQSVLDRVDIDLPGDAAKIARTLKTNLAYILINRHGPAIQPGSRDYARSWIRDGAITSGALLELGCTQEVREFLEWFARYQFADGKIPCCVDRRGADSVSENDSNGEFIYTVAEYYRYTHDVGFLHDMWPHVVRAMDYLISLREKRMTPAYQAPGKEMFYGLLPESISHEGYSAHPEHSYWDDFFALRGFKDAAMLAAVVDDSERSASYGALRDDFRRDLYASISKTMAIHGIDYIPGSAELGDFDPTSTAIALDPGGELAYLPEPALKNTFDRYYTIFEKRRTGDSDWDAYTPYELRIVGALIRLGEKARALELLNFFLPDQRPSAWNEWAEVVWRDAGAPKFIGDMPHTWVGSGFIRSVRSLLAYEREADRALVIAAGLPAEWALSQSGVTVRRLPTQYGILNYTVRREGAESLRVSLSGDLVLPPGKIVIESPLPQPLGSVTVNGKPAETFSADRVTIGEFPADVVLAYQPQAQSGQ
jgi:F5/8 type C domain/Amylo-alpha-1,6-glucosidase